MSASQLSPSGPQPFEFGAFLPGGHSTDPALPENSPTAGFKLNHFMLRIRDPRRSLHFYIDFMGMRTVGRDHRTLISTLGLLELYHIHGSEKPASEGGYEISTGNEPPDLGLGHWDSRGAGVRVIKELGVSTRESIPLSKSIRTIKAVFHKIAFVADPLVPQTMN
ncbi:hypothetical protein BDW75DRAFT_228849 [Aspergillus navahoensis]